MNIKILLFTLHIKFITINKLTARKKITLENFIYINKWKQQAMSTNFLLFSLFLVKLDCDFFMCYNNMMKLFVYQGQIIRLLSKSKTPFYIESYRNICPILIDLRLNLFFIKIFNTVNWVHLECNFLCNYPN